MSRRSRAREVVLQVLFQEDLNPEHDLHAADEFLRERLQRDPPLIEFALELLHGTRRRRPELDALLEAQSQHWSLSRMAATDRNVLRLAAFELRFTDTPGQIVIDEAVQLAKRFGSQQSASFVNGILDGLLPRDTKQAEG